MGKFEKDGFTSNFHFLVTSVLNVKACHVTDDEIGTSAGHQKERTWKELFVRCFNDCFRHLHIFAFAYFHICTFAH